MKYKLLQNAPNADKGDIFDIDASSRFAVYECWKGDVLITYTVNEVENNPDWFAPYLFTTEDKVDIYRGDVIWVLNRNNLICSWYSTENTIVVFCNDKIFSTKQAAEKYLEPKFKVGDYFVYDNEIYKIDNIKISSFISDNKNYDKALCRKATNDEIISYYEKQGWIKGAKFKEKGQAYIRTIELVEYDTCTNIVWIVGGQYPNKIEECELIKEPNYPKSWEDLKEIEGHYLSQYSGNLHFSHSTSLGTYKKVVFNTEKQALSCLTFAQLSQLVAEMNGDWQPNWNDHNQCKYVIDREFDTIYKCTTTVIFHPLAFKSKEARDFSFQHHEKYWKTYYQL